MDAAFLEEALENAAAFSAGMVDLEHADADAAAPMVHELFRRVHNLKGMAAMEEVPALAELAHAAEDLLVRYRDAGGRPSATEVDALLAAADAIDGMVGTLSQDGVPEPADTLIARLRALVPGPDEPPATDGPAASTPAAALAWPASVGDRYRVALKAGTRAPRARAQLVVRAVEELVGEVLLDPPALEGLDADHLSFLLGTADVGDDDALLARVRGFRDVDTVERVEVPEPVEPVERVDPAPERTGSDAGEPAGPGATGPAAPSAGRTVRVDVARLDQLLDLVGELVIERNRLEAVSLRLEDRDLRASVGTLTDLVADLRDAVGAVRMMSLESTFTRMQRLVRDVARELGKDVDLTLTGATTELDRSVVDEVLQPLVHLVRNAIDHGIEDAEARAASGKPPAGQIHIAAEQRGPEVVIEVRDDGAGIDLDGLARKAVERGLVSADELATLTPAQIHDVMFLPGFTSRDAAGMVSGRGVGLDVVRSEVEAHGGSVTVHSEAGVGSVFSLHFPLSLVVLDALLVEADGDLWALPVAKCRETLVLPADIAVSTGAPARFEHRGEQLPVIDGRRVLACREDDDGDDGLAPAATSFGVVVREGGGDHVLRVDRLLDRMEIVVKPAPRGIPGTEHIAGATILAEGGVALVPDLGLIVRRARAASPAAARDAR